MHLYVRVLFYLFKSVVDHRAAFAFIYPCAMITEISECSEDFLIHAFSVYSDLLPTGADKGEATYNFSLQSHTK